MGGGKWQPERHSTQEQKNSSDKWLIMAVFVNQKEENGLGPSSLAFLVDGICSVLSWCVSGPYNKLPKHSLGGQRPVMLETGFHFLRGVRGWSRGCKCHLYESFWKHYRLHFSRSLKIRKGTFLFLDIWLTSFKNTKSKRNHYKLSGIFKSFKRSFELKNYF